MADTKTSISNSIAPKSFDVLIFHKSYSPIMIYNG